MAHHEILMGPRYQGLLDDIFRRSDSRTISHCTCTGQLPRTRRLHRLDAIRGMSYRLCRIWAWWNRLGARIAGIPRSHPAVPRTAVSARSPSPHCRRASGSIHAISATRSTVTSATRSRSNRFSRSQRGSGRTTEVRTFRTCIFVGAGTHRRRCSGSPELGEDRSRHDRWGLRAHPHLTRASRQLSGHPRSLPAPVPVRKLAHRLPAVAPMRLAAGQLPESSTCHGDRARLRSHFARWT